MKIVALAILSMFLCISSMKAQTDDERTRQWVDSLDYYNKKGNGEKVLHYVDLLRMSRQTNGLFIMEANGYAYLKQYAKAISILKDSVGGMKDAHIGYSALGAIHELQEARDKAIEAYEKAKAIKPTYARPYIQLGTLYSQKGERQAAIDNYMEAVRLFAQNGYYEEMEVFSGAVLELDSTNIEAHKFLQYSYFNRNDHPAVINIGLKIDDLCIQQHNSKEGFANRVFMAMSLYSLKDYENTIDLLISAGSDEDTWNEYAYMICGYLSASYERTGNKDKSREYRELAKKISPDDADAWMDGLLSGK